jgi:DNA-binding beta-propeller fold protein YncE
MILGFGSGLAGYADGNLNSAQFDGPRGMAYDKENNVLYIADSRNNRIRKADLNSGEVTTFLGSGKYGQPGQTKVSGLGGNLNHPTDLLLDGNTLYIAMGGTSEIWKCDVRTAVAERFAGTGVYGHKDGKRLEAELGQPMGMAMDISGALFFTDAASSSIRSIDEGVVTTVSGGDLNQYGFKDGKGEEILFDNPTGLTSVDGVLYIADAYNHRIRKLEPFKQRSETTAGSNKAGYANGTGSSALLHKPQDLKHLSGALYITDSGNGLIRKYDLTTKTMSTISLSNHGLLGQGHLEMITDIRDGDTIRIGNGYNDIAVQIDLGEQYEIDYGGYSSASLISREDSIQLVAPGFESGTVHIGFRAEDVSEISDFAIDFNIFFKETAASERQFYRAVSYMYMVVKDPEAGTVHKLVTTFDPDADPWLIDESGEME